MNKAQTFSTLRRAAHVGFGVLLVFFFGFLALRFEGMLTGHAGPRWRARPELALFSFTVVFVILAAFGLGLLLIGLEPRRLAWFAKPGGRRLANVALWTVLILLFLGFASIFAHGRAP